MIFTWRDFWLGVALPTVAVLVVLGLLLWGTGGCTTT